MMPIKHAARFLNGAAFKPSDWGDTGLPILRIAQLTGKPFDNYFDGTINRGHLIKDGDLLFSWSATIDAFIWDRGDAILNQHIFKILPKKNTVKKYLYYVIKAHAPRWADDDAHGSTMRHIKKESLSNKVWIPDLATQRRIAGFLDRETARIDLAIEKKQRLAALLGERSQRIIDQLSADGLQGDSVEKKETGIDWLGKIPKHWTVEKLAWHFTAEKGRDAQKYTKDYCGQFPGPFPVYSGQTANEGVMGTIDSFDYDYGDQGVLFSTTVGAKAMTVAHLTGKFSLSQNCMIIVPLSKALPIRYFYYLLQPLFRKERSLIPEHMQASFRVEDLHRYWIAMPPNDEAKKIAQVIDTKVASLEPIQQKTQASIALLRERRAALISAAVTGQIDMGHMRRAQGRTDRHPDAIQEEMGA